MHATAFVCNQFERVNVLKKYIMMGVKLTIGLVPKTIRDQFKRFPWLTSLYSRSLQKSGLSYGIPTKRKTAKLYSRLIDFQEEKLNSLECLQSDIVLIILSEDHERLAFTLSSLVNQKSTISVILWVNDEAEYTQYIDKHPFKISVCKYWPSERELTNLFLINAGDKLYPNLASVIGPLSRSEHKLAYVDSDFITSKLIRHSPKLHCDWDPDLQLSTGYINTGLWLRTSSELSNGLNLLKGKTGIADFVANRYLDSPNIKIQHIPLVLVHSLNLTEQINVPLGKEVTEKISSMARVTKHDSLPLFHMLWKVTQPPLVSLIIPTKNSYELVKACIESILTKTTYQNYEILLIDNQSNEKTSLDYFAQLSQNPKIRVLQYNDTFNYSAINNFAVSMANGELVGLINNDIEVISPDWLTYMVGQACRNEIGCVGAKLLYPDGRIQHAGVVMGYGGGAGHAHKYFPREHSGYLNRLAATNCFSAVTAACLVVKKADYLAVGGLDEVNLQVAFNDVDFCLKVLALGRRNIYCAEAELFHHESVSRGFDDTKVKQNRFFSELGFLQAKWANYIQHDPAYNSNLTLRRENFSIKEC
jgi:GT2 family glycosyltransferase